MAWERLATKLSCTYGEQLQELPAVILVGCVPVTVFVVQPVERGRVLGDLHQELVESSQPAASKRVDLLDDQLELV